MKRIAPAWALGAALALPAGAQQVPADTVRPEAPVGFARLGAAAELRTQHGEYTGAAPSLPHDHWAVRAARRAEALGLADEFLPAQGAVPLDAVMRALRGAAARAPAVRPELASTALGWARRVSEEFRPFTSAGPGLRLTGSVGASAGAERGRLRPAARSFGERQDPRPLPDRTEGAALAEAAAATGPVFARVALGGGTEGVEVPVWEAGVRWGAAALSVGREAVAYGPARAGGIVLSGAAPLARVQMETAHPVALPGVLRVLGRATLHGSVARFTEARHPGDPWFFSARAAVQPHRRLTVGVSRAAIFGGDSVDVPTTARNIGRMLVGMLTGTFENQVVAADFRWRLPTERVVPATAYLEWGAEDAAGAWLDVPGRTLGVFLPALPRVPQVALGAEYTRFPLFCCGNPPWYAHAGQKGGWVHADRPLGHPLGGEGWEALGYAQGELADARLRLEARAFVRERGARGLDTPQRSPNLFAPARAGRSTGASLDAAFRIGGRFESRAQLFRDAGDGWREHRASAGFAYLF